MKSGKSLGEVGVKYFRAIYDVEDEVREIEPIERRRIRIAKAKPIWDEMKAWAEKKRGKVPALSKIGGAFKYLLGEYELLTNYLLDGRLEIDNGFTERAIRKFAIGRNNWLFRAKTDDDFARLADLILTP